VGAAGGAALAAGLFGALGLAERRTLVLPSVLVGALLLGTGLVVRESGTRPAVVLTTALAVVVMAGSGFPRLALGATGTGRGRLASTPDITAEPEVLDLVQLGADARIAHEILVSISAAVGTLLILVAPFAVSLGVAGVLVSMLACAVVLLRSRHYHARGEVLVGLVSGVLGLVSTAVSVLWMQPGWRPAAAAGLAATGAVLLALTLVPSSGSVRRSRLGDIAETVALLSMPPVLVVATGLFTSVGG
jgi:hypothetical protein